MKKQFSIFACLFGVLSTFLVSCGRDNGAGGSSIPHFISVLTETEPPLSFEKGRLERDDVVISRLLDIRTAQEAYRAEHGGKYAANFDELIEFLKGNMTVVNKTYILNDDQLVELRNFKIEDTKPANEDEMPFSEDEAYAIVLNIIKDSKIEGDKKSDKEKRNTAIKRLLQLDSHYNNDKAPGVKIADVFRCDTSLIAYVDTLFHNPNYDLQQIRYIPFSKGEDGKPVEFFMQADSLHTRSSANSKSGGYIHVFEARADFEQYLKGLDEYELNNYLLDVITNGTEYREVERRDVNGEPLEDEDGNILKRKIPCRKVGDTTKNNNNAGNWPRR